MKALNYIESYSAIEYHRIIFFSYIHINLQNKINYKQNIILQYHVNKFIYEKNQNIYVETQAR